MKTPFLSHEWKDRMRRMVIDLRNAGIEPMFRLHNLLLQPSPFQKLRKEMNAIEFITNV